MDLQCGAAPDLSRRPVRAVSRHRVDRPGDVLRRDLGVPRIGDSGGRLSVRAHAALRLCQLADDLPHRAHHHALTRWVREPRARDDNGVHTSAKERAMSKLLTRRAAVTAGLTTAAGAAGLGAAIHFGGGYGLIPPDHGGIVGIGETLTYSAQRLLTSGHSLAREFQRSDSSKAPVVNGPAPMDEAFRGLAAGGFKDWRLQVEGLIARPVSFSLEELKRLPAQSHILLHACEQGWSYIAEWTGVRLSSVLDLVKTRAEARYIVFMPFANPRQTTGEVRVQWDSIDMADALHPQTLLAYGINGGALPPAFGAPLRLRMGRQLGLKNTKYLSPIIITDRMDLYPKSDRTWDGGI